MIDELNNLRSIPYDEYFGKMNISKSQREKRQGFAEDFEEKILFVLAFISLMQDIGTLDWNNIEEKVTTAYRDSLYDSGLDVDALEPLIAFFVGNFIQTTQNMIDSEPEYALSADRAMVLSENEANNVFNKVEFDTAIAEGKKYKTWHTMLDKKVRAKHREEEGKKIPINHLFDVDGDLMAYPKDTTYNPNPDNIVNCRCSVEYS